MRKVLIGLMLLFVAAVAQAETIRGDGFTAFTGEDQTQACFSPHENCMVWGATQINKTISTLDLALYSLTHDAITLNIIDAHKAGVTVRVLIDVAQAGSRYADDEQLEEAGIEVYRIRSDKGGLMHHKFAIMDGISLFTGSFNWTSGGNDRNSENLILLHNGKLIKQFQAEFNHLWDHALKNWKHKQDRYRRKD